MSETPRPDRADTELRRAMGELAMQADTPPDYEELTLAVITSYDKGSNVMQRRTWILAAAAVAVLIALGAVWFVGGDDNTKTADDEGLEEPTALPEPTADSDEGTAGDDGDGDEPDEASEAASFDLDQLMMSAREAFATDPELALLLASEAHQAEPNPQTAGLLFDAVRLGDLQVLDTIETNGVGDFYPGPDGRYAVSWLSSALWDLTTDPPSIIDSSIEAGDFVWFNEDGSIFVARGTFPIVGQRIDPTTMEVLNDELGAFSVGRLTADGSSLILTGSEGLLEIDVATNEITRQTSDVPSGFLELTQDGRFAVVQPVDPSVTTADGVVVVDLESFTIVDGHPISEASDFTAARLLADDTIVAVTNPGVGTIELVRVSDGVPIVTLPSERRFVGERTTTSDGLLLTVDRDGFSVDFHDPTAGATVSEPIGLLIPGGAGQLEPVEVSMDGTRLFLRPDTSDATTWEIWSVDAAEWQLLACDGAGRTLTADERAAHGLAELDPAC